MLSSCEATGALVTDSQNTGALLLCMAPRLWLSFELFGVRTVAEEGLVEQKKMGFPRSPRAAPTQQATREKTLPATGLLRL